MENQNDMITITAQNSWLGKKNNDSVHVWKRFGATGI